MGRHDSREAVSSPHIRSGARAVTATCGGACRLPARCPHSPHLVLQSRRGAQRRGEGSVSLWVGVFCLLRRVFIFGRCRGDSCALSLCSGDSGFHVCECPDARRGVCLGGYRVILYVRKPSWALFWCPVSLGNRVLLSGPAFRTRVAGQGLAQFGAGVPPPLPVPVLCSGLCAQPCLSSVLPGLPVGGFLLAGEPRGLLPASGSFPSSCVSLV